MRRLLSSARFSSSFVPSARSMVWCDDCRVWDTGAALVQETDWGGTNDHKVSLQESGGVKAMLQTM